MEFVRLTTLSLRADAESPYVRGTHDSGPILSLLLKNPENWRLASGPNTTLFEATARAMSFVDGNQPTLPNTTSAEGARARTALCFYEGDENALNADGVAPHP
jgi:hypothetical protein